MGNADWPESQNTMKKTDQNKKIFLDQLSKNAVVEGGCQRIGISRMTFCRWRREDKEFAQKVDEAILEGNLLICDLAENQLIALIKDKNFSALQLWLRTHHPSYASRLEVSGRIDVNEELTPEQEALVKKALKLGSFNHDEEK